MDLVILKPGIKSGPKEKQKENGKIILIMECQNKAVSDYKIMETKPILKI